MAAFRKTSKDQVIKGLSKKVSIKRKKSFFILMTSSGNKHNVIIRSQIVLHKNFSSKQKKFKFQK